MCRSGPNARRCEHASQAAYSQKLLAARQRYYRRKGDIDKVQELESEKERLVAAQAEFGNHVSPLSLSLSPDTHKLLSVISQNGLTPMIVGGSVRDAFTGKNSKDIDIEVYGGTTKEVSEALRTHYHVDEVGKSFGVLKVVLPDGNDLDISLPRKDNKMGEGHRGFEVEVDGNMSFEDATSRRDYTFNSMMYSPEYGVLVDIHGGKTDMETGTLKHVSEAFAEDPLRVMRGFQFASRFNMTMHPDTVTLSKQLKSQASALSDERIKTEWEKFYQKGHHPSQGMKVLRDTEWDQCYPGLNQVNTESLGQRLDDTLPSIKRFSAEQRQRILGAAIAQNMSSQDAQEFLRKTSVTKKLASSSYALSQVTTVDNTDTSVRKMARTLHKKGTSLREWSLLNRSVDKSHSQKIYRRARRLGVLDGSSPDLLTGGDMIELAGKKPGPWVGQLQKNLRTAQDEGIVKNREEAHSWFKKELDSF